MLRAYFFTYLLNIMSAIEMGFHSNWKCHSLNNFMCNYSLGVSFNCLHVLNGHTSNFVRLINILSWILPQNIYITMYLMKANLDFVFLWKDTTFHCGLLSLQFAGPASVLNTEHSMSFDSSLIQLAVSSPQTIAHRVRHCASAFYFRMSFDFYDFAQAVKLYNQTNKWSHHFIKVNSPHVHVHVPFLLWLLF